MTSASEFLEILGSSLSPLVDRERMVIGRFKSSKGFTNRPGSSNMAVDFINLSQARHKERRGGGAESENNRMMFWISGFNEDPSDPVDKIRIKQSVNGVQGSKSMRTKTASPDKIAIYLAKYINETAESVPPNLTHED